MPAILAAVPVEVFVAVALLLLLYALDIILVKPLTWLFQKVPIIGTTLANNLANGFGDVTSTVTDWAKWGVNAMVQLVAVPVRALIDFVLQAIGTIEGIVSNLQNIWATIIAVAQSVSASISTVLGAVGVVAGHLAAFIVSIPGTVADIARSIVAAAVEGLRQAIGALSAALAAAVAAERALIESVKGNLLAFIAGQLGVVTASLTALVGSLAGQLAHDVQAIDGEFGQVWAKVDPLTGLLPLVASVPILAELVNIAEDCIIPQCNILGPTLPILSTLGDIATLALVGALVGEAVANPETAAQDTAAVVSGIEGLAKGLFDLFTGAAA